MSKANYIGANKRLTIQTFSDSFEACMSGVMTGEYIGLLPDYLAETQGKALGLVPVGGEELAFNHDFFIMNGKNTRLNPVLKHWIREMTYFSDGC